MRLAVLCLLFTVALLVAPQFSYADTQLKELRILRVTPAGDSVPAKRQIVIEFNRPVVPLGRMERTAEEVGVSIAPAVNCQWRWLNTSALACQLGEEDSLVSATPYKLTIEPHIAAEDGAQIAKTYEHTFTTRGPQVERANFRTWRAAGYPLMQVVFNQPVTKSSVAQHVYLATDKGKTRHDITVSVDEQTQDLPSKLSVPGEKYFLRLMKKVSRKSDDQVTYVNGEEARRIWMVEPTQELALDTAAELRVEAGLVSALGPQEGKENRTVVSFRTFPEFRFLGVTCVSNADTPVLVKAGERQKDSELCNPLRGVALSFSAPVLRSYVKGAAVFTPDLAGGRKDYDPWGEENRDYSMLGSPHYEGRTYEMYLPAGLKAAQRYRVELPAAKKSGWLARLWPWGKKAALEDEFGRALDAAVDITFATDHRKPNYELPHNDAVLEFDVDSEVPLYVNNLERVDVKYRRLTTSGAAPAQEYAQETAQVQDVQFAVPLGVREMLDGRSGALFGYLQTTPAAKKWDNDNRIFAQVTPWQVHAKLGHFRSLLWVTSFADGRPVANAKVSVYVDRFTELGAPQNVLASAVTDENGIATFAGMDTLDPEKKFNVWRDEDERIFLRVEKGEAMALLPVSYAYEISPSYVSDDRIYPDTEKKHGHMKAWGMTAQGIYRAGDTMQYKIYLRDQDNEAFIAPPDAAYTLTITDPLGKDVEKIENVKFSRFGSYAAEYPIAQTATTGWYRFTLEADFTPDRKDEDKLTKTFAPLSVLVSDFTPAPFRVSAELNGAAFHPGDKLVVDTAARLHSGGPYADASARITATLKSRRFAPATPVAKGFIFDSYMDEVETEQLWQKSSMLDGKGDLQDTSEVPARSIVYGVLEVESAVRDDRGKSVAALTSAKYMGVDRFVGLKTDKWVYDANAAAEVHTLVVDADGKPVEGVAVTGIIERETIMTAKVKGAGNAYLSDITVSWDKVDECNIVSGAEAQTCTFTPKTAGTYRVNASIKDTKGRAHTTQTELYVTGKDYVAWNTQNDLALPVVPEQREYKVGDTARYLVKNPWPGATALVTIERYGVIDTFTQKLEGSTPVISFPVKPDYLPGFYLSVVVTSPRVEAAPAQVGQIDMGKPSMRMAYVRVPVRDPYKEMAVEVTAEQEVYRPRDTVNVTLKATPRNAPQTRQPVELAVAVLDESVFDLVAGGKTAFDPYEGFYGLDDLDLRNYNLLTRLVGRQKFEKKGANPGGDGGSDIGMRNIFKYVSYWNPSVPVDSEGNAKISFEAPDNLTGWRVLALAVTPQDRMGLGEGTFKVNRPIEIRPVMPNQVRESDRFKAGFSVMNRTDTARTLMVGIKAAGDLKEGGAREHSAEITLEPYKRGTVFMDVATGLLSEKRDLPQGRITFAATASDGAESDGLEWSLPVLKSRTFDVAANYATTTENSVKESIAFPQGIHEDAGEVSLGLSPTVLGSLEGAFRYIRDYPYPCWEQVLTRGVMASHYQNLRQYMKDGFTWEDSAALPQATLDRAASYQAPNGGMTYFIARDEYADPYLSAYTAVAFNWLKDAGYKVPAEVESKLHGYLQKFLRQDDAPTFYSDGMTSSVRAVALAALAKAGKADADDVLRYRPHAERMGLFGKAHFLQAAQLFDKTQDTAREVADMIFASGNETGGKFMFTQEYDDGYTRILATPLRDNCAVLGAFMEYAQRKDAQQLIGDKPFKLVRTITQTRENRDHWENTQENMFCMAALVDYAKRYESVTPDMKVTAAMDGTPFGAAAFSSLRDPAVTLEKPIAQGDAGRKASVDITREGEGRLYYATRLRYASKAGFDSAVNAGMTIKREYSVKRDGKWVLLETPFTLARGEVVRVDLYLSIPAARNFVVVDDPLPGGLESVNTDLATASTVDDAAAAFDAAGGSWWFQYSDWREYAHSRWSFYHRELRHDAARFYADWLPAGNYHLSYAAQAVAEGDFAMLPVGASEMYDPDVYGRGVAGELKVNAADAP